MKKLLSLILSLVMLLSVVASVDLSAYADEFENVATGVEKTLSAGTLSEESPASDFIYEVSSSNMVTITKYIGTATEVVIPENIGGNFVRRIGSEAFSNCNSLTSVTIPDSLIWIESHAFSYCSNLTSITIPDSVIQIGAFAFSECSSLPSIAIPNNLEIIEDYMFYGCISLTSVAIPNSVESIENSAFSDCSSLTNITLPNSVTYLGHSAFMNCSSLEGLTIPESVRNLGYYVFNSCSSLASITVSEDNPVYDSRDNCNAIIETSSNTLITGCNNTVIPNDVTIIGRDAFYGYSGLTSITIPEGVTSIGDCAFYECRNLTSVTMPESLTSIGSTAFYSCSSLTSIKMPNSVTIIGDYAFQNCNNLTSITIPQSVTNIGDSAFYGCSSLTKIIVRNKDCEIYHRADTFPTSAKLHGYNGSTLNVYATTNNRTFVSIDNCQHTNTIDVILTEPTCTATGIKNIDCDHCGEILSKNVEIPKKAHTYKTKTVKATTSKNGYTEKKCSVCSVSSKTTIYSPKTYSLSTTTYTYNGKVKTPSVTVKDSKGKTLKKNTDYTVSYASGRKNVGKYAVKITFKGNYSGSKTLYFTIKPQTAKISSVKAYDNAFSVKWKKISSQTTGYQVQWSTSSKFKKASTKTITSNKTTSYKKTKLSNKKKYYVRVRTYKTVGKTKYYGTWSAVKSVKTK